MFLPVNEKNINDAVERLIKYGTITGYIPMGFGSPPGACGITGFTGPNIIVSGSSVGYDHYRKIFEENKKTHEKFIMGTWIHDKPNYDNELRC